jgi:hypothetical protein
MGISIHGCEFGCQLLGVTVMACCVRVVQHPSTINHSIVCSTSCGWVQHITLLSAAHHVAGCSTSLCCLQHIMWLGAAHHSVDCSTSISCLQHTTQFGAVCRQRGLGAVCPSVGYCILLGCCCSIHMCTSSCLQHTNNRNHTPNTHWGSVTIGFTAACCL